MTARVILELLATADRDPERWARIRSFFDAHRVTLLDEPVGGGPLTVRAAAPDDIDVEELVARLRELEGVGRVDIDAWREIS